MPETVSQTLSSAAVPLLVPVSPVATQSKPVAKTRAYSTYIWVVLYIISLAAFAAFLVHGWDYYTTPLNARPHHPDYGSLRPAGSTGLMFGIVGAAMMSLMMVYSLRKRARNASRWGTLRQWLNLHIYLGIMGPLCIILHTSFKIQGLVAVSFWSMAGVALSGFFGRYLYHQIPRSINGAQLTLKELKEQSEATAKRLRAEFGLSEETIARIDAMGVGDLSEDMGLLRSFWSMIQYDLEAVVGFRARQSEMARNLELPEEHLDELMALTRERFKLKRRTLLLGQVQRVFHYWHVIHKPFALVMYVIMAVHITVALWTGYAWRI